MLDPNLPKLDGLSVLESWRTNQRAMPVLVMTTRGAWHKRVESVEAGADDYLPKPLRMEERAPAALCTAREGVEHPARPDLAAPDTRTIDGQARSYRIAVPDAQQRLAVVRGMVVPPRLGAQEATALVTSGPAQIVMAQCAFAANIVPYVQARCARPRLCVIQVAVTPPKASRMP